MSIERPDLRDVEANIEIAIKVVVAGRGEQPHDDVDSRMFVHLEMARQLLQRVMGDPVTTWGDRPEDHEPLMGANVDEGPGVSRNGGPSCSP